MAVCWFLAQHEDQRNKVDHCEAEELITVVGESFLMHLLPEM